MSAAFRTTLRTSSRTALSRGSVARPVVRQSQRFLSASRPEGSNGGPHSGRTINLGSSAIYGIGAGLFFGVWSAFFNDPVKLEAIDFGDQGAEYSPDSKPKSKSRPKAKHGAEAVNDKPPESESPVSEPEGEEDSGNGAAFNPETGEINWDCPCLGGMAHGPCGEEFRAAFSCFVYSEAEPKGIECVEKFKGMQECFRAHPEVYGEEIMADDEEDGPSTSPSGTDSPVLETPTPLSDEANSLSPSPAKDTPSGPAELPSS